MGKEKDVQVMSPSGCKQMLAVGGGMEIHGVNIIILYNINSIYYYHNRSVSRVSNSSTRHLSLPRVLFASLRQNICSLNFDTLFPTHERSEVRVM